MGILADTIDNLQEGASERRQQVADALEALGERATEQFEDYQEGRTERVQAKAAGGYYTPEATAARAEAGADIIGDLADLAASIGTGGVSDASGGLGDLIGGLGSGDDEKTSAQDSSSSGSSSGGSLLLPLLALGAAFIGGMK